ncbi:MAG: FAD-dependent monooxygenase [Nitrospirae bacterium]|nr:FAD-dependent monooxygenase [Nitrospirota bacterium]
MKGQETSIKLQTKVLIIGGGPAGSTAARFLADNGIETIVAERDLSYIKPCGGGIPSSALDELDIPQRVVKKEVKKIRIISPKGEETEIELKGGALCIAERGAFDSTLREMAKAKGASIIEGEFVRFEEIGRNIISTIIKKSTREAIRIKSDYVIVSNGATSQVGAGIKAPKQNYIYTISAHIKPNDYDACEFWFGTEHASNFYSWIFPSREYASIGTGSADPQKLTRLLECRNGTGPLRISGIYFLQAMLPVR